MKSRRVIASLACAALLTSLLAAPLSAQQPFAFREVGEELGLRPAVEGIAGHAAAWGDIDGDGRLDLYVGTFRDPSYGSKKNMLFRFRNGRFVLDDQETLQVSGRAGGSVFADLDNDGDLDLYLSNHAIGRPGHFSTPNFLWENLGGGKFKDISEASGARPDDFRGRSVAVLDYDGDGRLDLLVGEGFLQGGKGRSKLFKNLGNLRFRDVSRQVGLPEKITGMGVAAGDLTGDGWPDICLAGRDGGNRVLVNDGRGKFRVVPETHANFAWEWTDLDDTTCGAALGDVNRDGRLDILIGQHYGEPWVEPVPVKLYLNRGVQGGWPKFEDVTAAAGVTPLPMKAPHVEIQDFDNDGWPDIYGSIVKFADGRPHPAIYHNQGLSGGLPRFKMHAMAVNDFPTADDKKTKPVGKFFEKMIDEGRIIYMAPGPTADFNRDGRLDMFLCNWWVDSPSLLLQNETDAGNWLQVEVRGSEGVNRQGVGSAVRLYRAGQVGRPAALLGAGEIMAGYGYASGQEAVAHFGLGEAQTCDVEIILPHGKGRIVKQGVQANQRLTVER